jgi:hypothetical protein
MPLFEDCKEACSDVLNTVKRGADNVTREDLDMDDLCDLQSDIVDMRKKAGNLANQSLDFAENKQVAMVYAYAHYVKKYGAARCMGQASLAATLLLKKKINCAIGIIKMGGGDQHVFAIANANPQLGTGTQLASLSPALIVDPWIVMKCKSEDRPVATGVFNPQEYSNLVATFNYETTLSFFSYMESPFV